MALSNTPFPCFKSTSDDKHDIDIYTEDLKDYCVMQNWFDSSKETEAQRWTKPDKAIACLRASMSLAARAIYKYSLGLRDEDQKKPLLVIDALRKFYGASIGVSGERQKFLRLLQEESERSLRGKHEFVIKEHCASMKILRTNLSEINL